MKAVHKNELELKHELQAAAADVSIGDTYRHYKSNDKTYAVIGLGFLEATDELCVIYQASYGERITFIRPLRVWLEAVEWQGATVPRFVKI